MIEIKATKNKLTVKGHAGYSKTGDDIVCSAISTILQSLVIGNERLTDSKIHYQLKSGDSWIEFEKFSPCSLILYKNFVLTAEEISKEYPENVRVVLDETDKIY